MLVVVLLLLLVAAEAFDDRVEEIELASVLAAAGSNASCSRRWMGVKSSAYVLNTIVDSPGASPPSAASSLALRQSLARAHDLQHAVHESATPHHRGRFAYAVQPSPSLSTHLGSSPAHALPSSSLPCGHRTVTSSLACACSSLVAAITLLRTRETIRPRRGRVAAVTRAMVSSSRRHSAPSPILLRSIGNDARASRANKVISTAPCSNDENRKMGTHAPSWMSATETKALSGTSPVLPSE